MADQEGISVILSANTVDFNRNMRDAANAASAAAGTIGASGQQIQGAGALISNTSADIQSFVASVRSGQATFVGFGTAAGNVTQRLGSLSPAASAAVAGITNLRDSINRGTVSFNGIVLNGQRVGSTLNFLTTSAERLNISIRDFNRTLLATSPVMRGFVNDARNGQLSFVGLNGAVTSAGRAAATAGTPFNNFGRRVADGSNTLTQFNRIVQDAPFGIIGIGNNITATAESFGNLIRTSGSAGAALKAMGSAFLGFGGVTFALSTAISLSTALTQKYGSLAAAVDALNPFLSAAVKNQLALNLAMQTGAKDAQGDIAHLTVLYQATQSLTVPMADRNRLVDELQKKYPAYFSNFSKEEILAGKAAAAYVDLKNAIIASAQAKAIESKIAEKQSRVVEIDADLAKAQKKLDDLRKPGGNSFFERDAISIGKDIERVQNTVNKLTAERNRLMNESNEFAQRGADLAGKSSQATAAAADQLKTVPGILKSLNAELKAVDDKSSFFNLNKGKFSSEKLQALNSAFEALSKIGTSEARSEMTKLAAQITSLEGVATNFKADNKISAVLKRLAGDLAANDDRIKQLGGPTDDLIKGKIGALQKAFEDLITLGLKPSSPELQKITGQINILSTAIIGTVPLQTKNLVALGKAFQTIKAPNLSVQQLQDLLAVGDKTSQLQLSPNNIIPPTIQAAPGLENIDKYQAQFNQRLDKLRANIQAKVDKTTIIWGNLTSGLGPVVIDLGNQLRGAAASAATGLGELIGSVASGGASLGSALGKLVGVMGQFIIDFGKSLIEAATLRIIAEKTLFANPYVALAAGIGAIAIGTVLKNSVPSFATGGIVTKPTLAMIGDNPGRKEAVIPSELWPMLGGGNTVVEVTGSFEMRNEVLLAAVTQGQKQLNRRT
jgi:hypothetical protein